MPRRRKIDTSKIIEAVESGRLSIDTMNSFGLERTKRKPGRPRKRSARPSWENAAEDLEFVWPKDLKVNKRGSLVLPRGLVQELGFNPDDTLRIRKTKVGINVRKA